MDELIKYKVEWHDDTGTLCNFSFETKKEALEYVEKVKPSSWFPELIEVHKIGVTYAETSTTDYDELTNSPWLWQWGRHIWWDGVTSPDHLRKERTNG